MGYRTKEWAFPNWMLEDADDEDNDDPQMTVHYPRHTTKVILKQRATWWAQRKIMNCIIANQNNSVAREMRWGFKDRWSKCRTDRALWGLSQGTNTEVSTFIPVSGAVPDVEE